MFPSETVRRRAALRPRRGDVHVVLPGARRVRVGRPRGRPRAAATSAAAAAAAALGRLPERRRRDVADERLVGHLQIVIRRRSRRVLPRAFQYRALRRADAEGERGAVSFRRRERVELVLVRVVTLRWG
eukprot:9798-Pelagococcus_subviridis.AAC.1